MIEAAGLYRLLSHAFTKDRYDPSAHGTLIGLAKTAAERSHDLRKALYDITPALVRALYAPSPLLAHLSNAKTNQSRQRPRQTSYA